MEILIAEVTKATFVRYKRFLRLKKLFPDLEGNRNPKSLLIRVCQTCLNSKHAQLTFWGQHKQDELKSSVNYFTSFYQGATLGKKIC